MAHGKFQVVGNQKYAFAPFFVISNDLPHKAFGQSIQGRSGFIHDQDVGIQDRGHGQKASLDLPATQLIGVPVMAGFRQAHVKKRPGGPGQRRFSIFAPLHHNGFSHLVDNPVGRIQALGTVLKDH